METLTKENFWNEMEQKYPKATKHFQNWIDGYKNADSGHYYALFNASITTHLDSDTKQPVKTVAPKYHELPIAMQFGIFCEYGKLLEKTMGIAFYFDYQSTKTFEDCTKFSIIAAFKVVERELI